MRKNIVVIGASAGGIEALKKLFATIPEDFDASVFVVVHTSPNSPGLLGEILERSGPLHAVTVRTSEPIKPATVYVAAPDHHLIIEPGVARATKGPRENRFRPAVDPLFRSAAQTYGGRVIGVVLTGALDDGTAGLWAVKHLGGTAVVQDPSDAYADSMPRSAMQHIAVDYCEPLSEIGALLVRLTQQQADGKGVTEMPKRIPIEVEIAKADKALDAGVLELGHPSNYACPECHGVLLELEEGSHIRFRCHTGHAYSPACLLAEVNEAVEEALWNAIRSVEEGALLMQRLANHAQTSHDADTARRLLEAVSRARAQADLVRGAVLQHSMHQGLPTAEDGIRPRTLPAGTAS